MYEDFEVKPYINPKRNLALEDFKPVPRKNMEWLNDGLLAGDIILLWRINFGTFTNETWFPKYFEYIYGIDAPLHLEKLIAEGYAYIETAFDSLDHITSGMKKKILKQEEVKGFSAMKASELDEALKTYLTENELAEYFEVRGIALTDKGLAALAENQAVIDRHPKKKL